MNTTEQDRIFTFNRVILAVFIIFVSGTIADCVSWRNIEEYNNGKYPYWWSEPSHPGQDT